jgi:hypothetical protein
MYLTIVAPYERETADSNCNRTQLKREGQGETRHIILNFNSILLSALFISILLSASFAHASGILQCPG